MDGFQYCSSIDHYVDACLCISHDVMAEMRNGQVLQHEELVPVITNQLCPRFGHHTRAWGGVANVLPIVNWNTSLDHRTRLSGHCH